MLTRISNIPCLSLCMLEEYNTFSVIYSQHTSTSTKFYLYFAPHEPYILVHYNALTTPGYKHEIYIYISSTYR